MLKDTYPPDEDDYNKGQEREVSLHGVNAPYFDDPEYPMVAHNNDLHDIEMGIEEQKKEKTKTPSTGKHPYLKLY